MGLGLDLVQFSHGVHVQGIQVAVYHLRIGGAAQLPMHSGPCLYGLDGGDGGPPLKPDLP